MPQPGQTGSLENSTAPLTRRELRALRESGQSPVSTEAPAEAETEATAADSDAVVSAEPVTVVAAEPLTVVAAEPVTVVAAEPLTAVAAEPVTVVAAEPVTVVAAEPVTVVSAEPLTLVATELPTVTVKRSVKRVKPVVPPVAKRPHRPKQKNPLMVAFTLLAIPGMFLTAALPAYAFMPGEDPNVASSVHQRTSAEAQGVTVAATAVTIEVARDGFSATTPEQIAAKARAAAAKKAADRARDAARSAAAAYAVYGIRAEGDDYPWAGSTSGLSPLGYVYGQCVDFVAWRLNRDAGVSGGSWRWTWSNLTPSGGNASEWASAWSGHGWATSSAPVVGAVAWFNYNHVGYVRSINSDGSIDLEEYNWMGSSAYHTRTIPAGEVPLYLYPPA